MTAQWHVTVQGKQHGPFTDVQLANLVKKGKLASTDLVRKLDGPWVAASEVRGLFAQAKIAPAPIKSSLKKCERNC